MPEGLTTLYILVTRYVQQQKKLLTGGDHD